MRFLRWWWVFLLGFSSARGEPLTVAAAASLQPVFASLAQGYRAQGGGALQPVFGSSGKLFNQIAQGAPFHLFLSADTSYPERLVTEGHARSAARVYARGELVLWSGETRDLHAWRALLVSPAIRHIAVAHPDLAPHGREAVRLLRQEGIWPEVEGKLVYGESVAQTNQFIVTGAAEVGFTAKSAVVAPETDGRGSWVAMPAEGYAPIEQAAVVLEFAREEALREAEAFLAFLLSPEAGKVLRRHGYLPP